MKRMMKVAALTACVGAMLCFAGCGKGDSNKGAVVDAKVAFQGKSAKDVATTDAKDAKSDNDPVTVVLSLMKAMASGNADDAFIKSRCTERTATSMMMVKDALKVALKGATFEVVDVKINGEEAVVMVKQNGGLEGAGITEKVPLKKVGGQWKCDNY